MVFIEPGITIDVRLEQSENAYCPNSVTPFGIEISVRLAHPRKAEASILFTFLGILIDVSFEHPENNDSDIEISVSGRTTVCRLVQFPKKA